MATSKYSGHGRDRREKAYDPGYKREEDRFNDSMNSAQRLQEKRQNAGYAREEAAFNRNRNPGADKMNAQRLANERGLKNAADRADRYGQYMQGQMSKNVPSTRPGESGREWEDHKYIDKVQTKTGKTRYIYEVETASGRHSSSKGITNEDLSRAKDELSKAGRVFSGRTSPKSQLRETQEKATSRNTGGSDKEHNIFRDARDAIGKATYSVQKAASDGANYVSKALSDVIASTPIKDLFK